MNPAGREPWPPSQSAQGPSGPPESHPHHGHPLLNQPSLPPPGASSHPPHSLAALAGLQQISSPDRLPISLNHSSAGGVHYPANNVATSAQSISETERDVERDRRDARMMEDLRLQVEQRDSEMRDRQSNGEPQILHQPVAVPPSARVLGPNGILGNQGHQNIPPIHSAINGPQIFASIPHQSGQAIQQQQPQLLMPFNPTSQTAGGLNQPQTPILNDALSYLDQVKVQFHEQPDVYNRFLDIMKDFKSSAIDTPGVIDRVSQLFVGNPSLIQGFNTFLPQGYRIECGLGDDPNSIRVTTPMGTSQQLLQPRPPSQNDQRPPPAAERGFYEAPRYLQQMPIAQEGFGQDARGPPPGFGQPVASGPMSMSPENRRDQAGPPLSQQDQRGFAVLQQAAPVADARGSANRNVSAADAMAPIAGAVGLMNGHAAALSAGGVSDKQRGPVEFNHAINYVNKIKNRFSSQPDIYKQFLEILQTYQRESKPIGDVYNQVTNLFRSAPDLLEDFKQFLPDSAAHANANAPGRKDAEEDVFPLSSLRGEANYAAAPQAILHQTPRPDQPRLPPMGSFGPTPSSTTGKKRARDNRQGAPVSSSALVESSSGRAVPGQPGQNKKQRITHVGVRPVPLPEQAIVPVLPGASIQASAATMPNDKDFHMIERIRKQINNKTHFTEFIKLMNLYTQDLITAEYLIYRAQAWLPPDTEHIEWLKQLFGIQDQSKEVKNISRLDRRISLNRCRALGPSYRLLPKQEHTQVCSGRDELCRSVLNDEWASHPTMQSEEGGFVAHKKTPHEEALHRIEEERHDYDSSIECIVRTIQLLDPIVRHLKSISDSARREYKPDTKLGGQSEAIYKRTIYKLYGRIAGNTVIEGLMNACWRVAPTLLIRCKDTLEKWKAAQRQWNEVWRQQTLGAYHKSLDPQGSQTTRIDKRQFQQKTLMQEIKTVYEEQRKRPLSVLSERRRNGPNSEGYQYVYQFKNEEVLQDVKSLIVEQLKAKLDDTTIATRVEQLLNSCTENDDVATSTVQDIPPSETSEASDSASPSAKSSKRSKSLRKAALANTSGKTGASASASRDVTPTASSGDEEPTNAELVNGQNDASNEIQDTWTELVPHNIDDSSKRQGPRSDYHLYCNMTLYAFFRLFGMLYERLEALYDYEEEVKKLIAVQTVPKPARELGILEREPGDFFPDPKLEIPGNTYYKQIIEKFRTQIISPKDVTQGDVEDILRRYYLQCGWPIYHFDRLLNNAERNAAILYDIDKDRASDLLELFKKDRKKAVVSHPEELRYRNNAQKMILGANKEQQSDFYRVTLRFPLKSQLAEDIDMSNGSVNESKEAPIMMIQILDKDSPTIASTNDQGEKFNVYVSSYQLNEPTEDVAGISTSDLPYLKSQGLVDDESSFPWAHIDSSENLHMKITDKYRAKLQSGGSEAINSIRIEEPPADGETRNDDARRTKTTTTHVGHKTDGEGDKTEDEALIEATA